MARSLLLVKIRAPHRDARRTLSTPTRRAPDFFPCARLCSTFWRSETPRSKSLPLVSFAPADAALLTKVRVAICISTAVAHVGRRLGSILQLLTLQSGISWRSYSVARKMSSQKVWCSERNARFSSSRRRTGPRDNHQEGRRRDARAVRCL